MPQLTREELIALSKAAQYEFDSLARVSSSSDWAKMAAELGFAEVGGRWLKSIPGYASTVKQSVSTAGAVAGTTATIYETVTSPVSKIIASNTGTKVTTSGILTATSTSVGAAACAGALGFTMGVNWFEAMPEAWTEFSNLVFGTDLDPSEIGQLARDTNALVMIKDGVCYMAEDLVTAIRDALFDIGAADTSTSFPARPTESTITLTTYDGTLRDCIASLNARFLDSPMWTTAETAAMLDYKGLVTGYFTLLDTNRWTGKLQVYVGTIPTPQDCTVTGVQAKVNVSDYTVYTLEFDTYYNAHPLPVVTTISGTSTIDAFVGKYGPDSLGQYFVGNANTTVTGGVDGVTPTGEQGTKDQTLYELFPDWVANAVTTIGDFPDTIRRWLPLTLPSTQVEAQGNPLTITEAQTGALPLAETEAALQLQANTDPVTTTLTGEAVRPTPLPLPIPTITPTPGTPSITGGGGSSTGLANLYNPTLAQVKQFSRWLWGSDGLNLDQLKKLLQDPMQAIIGLHVMYATPTTGANRDIQVGYINSGVQSKIVTEQYTEIDCGTVTINEYFGDARDYSPYTQVYCYLPFIGIVELNADDVVNSTLGIKYKIDVLTGCCLAQLTVKKFGLDAVLYTYTGNCAVQMPITSGNYLSTVSSLLGAVVSGAAAVATGGALAPVAIGAAANAMGGGARASVAMSGSLGSNAGAMGIRKPYLIIKRVESADANGYNEFYGYPTNKRVNLSQLTGYVRVKEINLSGTNATEDEQNEIVTLLKEGVIL